MTLSPLSLLVVILSLLLFSSLSKCATFDSEVVSNARVNTLVGDICDTDEPAAGTRVMFLTEFDDPVVSSVVTFEYLAGNFPFEMDIRFACGTRDDDDDDLDCEQDPTTVSFDDPETLNDFLYESTFLPGSCSELDGKNITCEVGFCSIGVSNAQFKSNLTSSAEETRFPTDKSIPLPGPRVTVEDGEEESFAQLFTFKNSEKKGTFTLSLDNQLISSFFSSIGVNGKEISLEDEDDTSFSIEVEEEGTNYFSLLESNLTFTAVGTVKFEEIEPEFPMWIVIGVVVGVVVILAIVLAVYFLVLKKPAKYEEVA